LRRAPHRPRSSVSRRTGPRTRTLAQLDNAVRERDR
jgi:hypothetical protein